MLLTRIPRYVIQKIAPDYEPCLDSTDYKTFKIAVSSTLFGLIHLTNAPFIPNRMMLLRQVALTTVLGVALGIIKESDFGLMGAIGGHIGYNLPTVLPLLFCED